jgi:hypothetical protein
MPAPEQGFVNSPEPPTAIPFSTSTVIPPNKEVWVGAAVSADLRTLVIQQGYNRASAEAGSLAQLELAVSPNGEATATWVYALVAAFPTVRDSVTFDELKNSWQGSGPSLLMTEVTYAAMQAIFGEQSSGVRLVAGNELMTSLWAQPGSWGIVPFESLDPQLKVLEIEGISPVRKDFEEENYPLKVYFRLVPPVFRLPASNRDSSRLTTVVMTGTTALVRAISAKMRQNGVEYPARDIGDWLRGADIFHTSSEVAFVADCPDPDPYSTSLRFCSALENIQLLDFAGVDVIELSGNHVNDWGVDALSSTLEIYAAHGWPVYAGGINEDTAKQPAVFERSGTRFVFLGCNLPGPEFAWAAKDSPGSAACGNFEWLVEEIKRQKANDSVVIVTLQHYEYYSPEIRPSQRDDFERLAEAGAVLVSGSQAHFAQAMEFHNGVFIHYGLGNLFFDQMQHYYDNGVSSTDIRREFLDRYVFYGDRLVSIELLTAVLEDYSKPRPMTPEERSAFLEEYFLASGWQP